MQRLHNILHLSGPVYLLYLKSKASGWPEPCSAFTGGGQSNAQHGIVFRLYMHIMHLVTGLFPGGHRYAAQESYILLTQLHLDSRGMSQHSCRLAAAPLLRRIPLGQYHLADL
jgi:hypothetical protein